MGSDGLAVVLSYLISAPIAVKNGGYVTVGVMAVAESSAPEVTLSNPVFDMEIGKHWGRHTMFVRHDSGVFKMEQGLGMNSIGYKYTFGKRF